MKENNPIYTNKNKLIKIKFPRKKIKAKQRTQHMIILEYTWKNKQNKQII